MAFIAIAGNIGAGKTTLTDFLCQTHGLTPFFEPNEQNPFLQDFFKDMRQWAFKSQMFFLTHKFKLHLQLMQHQGTVIQDRTIYEDAEIFALNLYRMHKIEPREYGLYRELYESLTRVLRPPDLLIYLNCPMRTTRQRIRLRGRPEEQALPLNYLKRLQSYYDAWLKRWTMCPVLHIDTSKLDYLGDLLHRLDLIEQIEAYLDLPDSPPRKHASARERKAAVHMQK